MNMADYETINRGLSVLIVAYRRWKNVALILEACQQAGIKEIYLSLDAPRDNAKDAQDDQIAIKKIVLDFEARTGRIIRRRFANANQGCAVNVIRSCDWAFETSDALIVLEDDCLPSPVFFDFCRTSIVFVKNRPDCWLLCGTQFVPDSLMQDHTSLSRYALTWGWATHKSKWSEMRQAFFDPSTHLEFKELISFSGENSFWKAGSRRAMRGFTDVWDTILLERMQHEKKYAILPPHNLIENVGNDEVSTHTESTSPWTGIKVQTEKISPNSFPVRNPSADKWLVRHFYKIRFRHIFTTKLTLFLDLLFPKKRKKFNFQLLDRLLQ